MSPTCSPRRRVSKKWLTVILACCLIDSLVVLLYYQLGRGKDPRLVTEHHDVHQKEISKNIVSSQSSARREEGKPAEALQQNVNYMENILNKMEKSMEKDKEQLDSRLPKPVDMVGHQEGPAQRISVRQRPARKKTVKLVIVAREHTGFPVLEQFFTEKNDFFVHGEPPLNSDPATVGNLLNCLLSPAIIKNFSSLITTDFGRSSYFRGNCLLGSGTICSDPLSYETFCSAFPHQVLHSRHLSLNFARQLMEENSDIKVIFLVRDPRGILRDSKIKPSKLCSSLSSDWDSALRLMSDFPHQFTLTRYETLAVAPQTQLENLLRSLQLPTLKTLTVDDVNEDEEDWSPKKNSITRVNSWKSGLTSKELKSIENVCVETLSKMEYQLLSPE